MKLTSRSSFAVLLLVAAGLAPTTVWGQAVTSASIVGSVADDSGAVIPGVTVTVTSPALQVPEVTTVTDGAGNYRVLNLPAPGVYRIAFTLDGFQTFVREGVNISVGFAARIDARLNIGALAETLTVTGASPVIDTVATNASISLQRAVLDSTPIGGGVQELFPMVAGVTTGTVDVGDSFLATRSAISTYGIPLSADIEWEGLNIASPSHDKNTGQFYSSYGMAEAQFKTVGNNADVGRPGMNMVAVLKSGGNEFHGSYFGEYERSSFQGDNITPALAAQGIRSTNPIDYFYVFSADLGGRIIRDKLWFFALLSRQEVSQGQIGYVQGPNKDGCYLCGDAPPAFLTTWVPTGNYKVSYQPTPRVKLSGAWMNAAKNVDGYNGGPNRPFESTMIARNPNYLRKLGFEMTPSNNWFIDIVGGSNEFNTDYQPVDGVAVAGNPARQEITTGYFLGTNMDFLGRSQINRRYQVKGNVTYLRGNHTIKFGTDNTWEPTGLNFSKEYPNGDYLLLFNGGRPVEMRTYNFPVTPKNDLHSQSAYMTDSWRVAQRLTLNLGVRWDRYHNFLPEQTKQPGQFSAGATYAYVDALKWTDVVPRVGATWDVNGNGKTVIKGFFGMFGDSMGNTFANIYNPNGLVITRYRWTGPCKNVTYYNGYAGCDYLPGSVNLSPSGEDFISASGGANVVLNPDLKQYRYNQGMIEFGRELMDNFAFTLGYVYNKEMNSFDTAPSGINILRPYSAFNVPVVLKDPYDKAEVTVWTYPASYAGSAFNSFQIRNAPSDRSNTYHSFSVTVRKRFSNKLNMDGSFWTVKNHRWIVAIAQSPNDDLFPIDDTWNWQARWNGSYTGPFGLIFSGYWRASSGTAGQRTQVFSNPALRQGSTTLRMEPFGAQRGPLISTANLKIARQTRLVGKVRLEPSFQVFNLFNSGSATQISYLSSTLGRVTGIISPRVARVGLRLSF
jgi:hypothetical protein